MGKHFLMGRFSSALREKVLSLIDKSSDAVEIFLEV
jgi:hypothetical protein